MGGFSKGIKDRSEEIQLWHGRWAGGGKPGSEKASRELMQPPWER